MPRSCRDHVRHVLITWFFHHELRSRKNSASRLSLAALLAKTASAHAVIAICMTRTSPAIIMLAALAICALRAVIMRRIACRHLRHGA
jgi:hypothetical protein